jgi:hypothetical protein
MKPVVQFIVGNQYEFSDGEEWVKGKAVGTVDYEGQSNFVAEINGKLSVFEYIRRVQEITKEDLVFLLRQWEDAYRRNALIISDDRYSESMFHLSEHTDSVLYNLKTKTK